MTRWARQDSNLGPTDYESAALPAELRAPRVYNILQDNNLMDKSRLLLRSRSGENSEAAAQQSVSGQRTGYFGLAVEEKLSKLRV